jgi:hypothetical protein
LVSFQAFLVFTLENPVDRFHMRQVPGDTACDPSAVGELVLVHAANPRRRWRAECCLMDRGDAALHYGDGLPVLGGEGAVSAIGRESHWLSGALGDYRRSGHTEPGAVIEEPAAILRCIVHLMAHLEWRFVLDAEDRQCFWRDDAEIWPVRRDRAVRRDKTYDRHRDAPRVGLRVASV